MRTLPRITAVLRLTDRGVLPFPSTETAKGRSPRERGSDLIALGRELRPLGLTQNYELELFALTSYEVLVASKKFTNWRVSLAVAIHLAGFDTL